MDELMSKVREDNLITHDYLSIAVEFDTGQDITYYWSSELPVGAGFRCPIPTLDRARDPRGGPLRNGGARPVVQ
jgi:hypothetical protein